MKKLFILCGLPASGKTTLSKRISDEYNITRYSFDELKCFQHKELIKPIVKSLLNDENVIVDSVYVRLVNRKDILNATSDIDCKRILIYLDTSLEECIRRNLQRPNPLSEFMIRDIYKSIEIPSLDEGWDEIIIINNDKDIEKLENSIKNILNPL